MTRRVIGRGLSLGLLAALVGGGRGSSALPKEAGWESLFDGKSMGHWRGFRTQKLPVCWKVEGGTLHRTLLPYEEEGDCGDLTSRAEYGSFELEFEFRISPGGNSGVKYLVPETRPLSWERSYMRDHIRTLKREGTTTPAEIAALTLDRWKSFPMGFEYQVADDTSNGDARSTSKHATAALYDLFPPSISGLLQPNSFNKGRILVKGDHFQHWINGVKVVDVRRGTTAFQAALKKSKFRNMPGFGQTRKGHITLQDHGDEVWFRNLRIRML